MVVVSNHVVWGSLSPFSQVFWWSLPRCSLATKTFEIATRRLNLSKGV